MMDRQHGAIVFMCDQCHETFQGERGEDFETVWGSAKREGWSARMVGDDWYHGCPQHKAK